MRLFLLALLGCLGLAAACGGETATPPGDSHGGLGPLGGATTVDDASMNALAFPARNLPRRERGAFQVGDSFFNRNWVFAPASTKSRDGLGPLFHARSCSGCHVRDGRGAAPEETDEVFPGALVRWSVPDGQGGAEPVPGYGSQLQPLAPPGHAPEARATVAWEPGPVVDLGGRTVTLRRPRLTISDPGYGALPRDLQTSLRVAPAVHGMGLLEAIPEADLRARADPDDRDGDGISGRVQEAGERAGRFGWKAGQPTIRGQTAAAFLGDLGVTSPEHPRESLPPGATALRALPDGGHPEANEHTLGRVVFYVATLAVPAARPGTDGRFARGLSVFRRLRCDACHVDTWTTGASTHHDALAHQTIHPFTDLLLHDLGEGLADKRPEGRATGREWRTPPLWGLGMVMKVSGHTTLLHDGRARNVEEAILWHGGEAQAARDGYVALPEADRENLRAFLERL